MIFQFLKNFLNFFFLIKNEKIEFLRFLTILLNKLIVDEEMEGSGAMKPRLFHGSSSVEGSEKNIFNLMEKINEINFSTFNEEIKNRLIFDLKAVTLKNWTHKFYSEVLSFFLFF